MKAFLMTYTSFTTPQKLLRKLIQRYNVPQPQTKDSQEYENFIKNTQIPIQLRVCSTIKHWMEHYWNDFDHELTEQVVSFVDNLPENDTSITPLRKAILKRVY